MGTAHRSIVVLPLNESSRSAAIATIFLPVSSLSPSVARRRQCSFCPCALCSLVCCALNIAVPLIRAPTTTTVYNGAVPRTCAQISVSWLSHFESSRHSIRLESRRVYACGRSYFVPAAYLLRTCCVPSAYLLRTCCVLSYLLRTFVLACSVLS